MSAVATGTLLELDGLCVDYVLGDRRVRAVDNVSLSIAPGEILGLAGESGCGKSTLASAVLQILKPPAEVAGGRILFQGRDLVAMSRDELRGVRWRHVSLVFQSAMNVLNPVMRVGDQFVDMYKAHDRIRRSDALARAGDLLELVGIERKRVRSYPHELSGGMRQRVVIAMALALEPELIVMDEPTTALDVVVQREILQELEELKRRLGFAVLFITHDLSLLVEFSDRIAIMYAGEIVESASSDVSSGTRCTRTRRPDELVPAAHRADRAAHAVSRARRPTWRSRPRAAVSTRAARSAPASTARCTACRSACGRTARDRARPPGGLSLGGASRMSTLEVQSSASASPCAARAFAARCSTPSRTSRSRFALAA